MALRRCAVVAGGAGFIGSHLCERLLDEEYEVVCLDDLSTGRRSNLRRCEEMGGFRLLQIDVTHGVHLEGDIEAVFHLASPASPAAYLKRPIATLSAGSDGTKHLLELARRKGARFILASTSEVYGDPQVHPQPETYWGNVNPVGPRSVYDEAKRFSEALTVAYRQAYGVETAIVRIFNTYGPRMLPDDGRMIPAFLAQAMREEPITVHGDGRQTRSLCYVDDTVDALIRIFRSGHPGPVNVGTSDEFSVLEIARLIRDTLGSSSSIVFTPARADDPRIRRPDVSLARSLGWGPQVPLAEGLKKTIADSP